MGEEEAKDEGDAPAEGEQKLSKNQLKKLAKGKVSLAQVRTAMNAGDIKRTLT